MILRRLCEAAKQFDFPPIGYQEGPVKWIVHLDDAGKCLGFVRTIGDEKRKNDPGKMMMYPATATPRSGTQAPPQLLTDNASYALGLVLPDATLHEQSRVAQNHARFRQLLVQCIAATDCEAVKVVLIALESQTWRELSPPELKPDDVVTFMVGNEIPIELPHIKQYWTDEVLRTREDKSAEKGICLVCGIEGDIANPHPKMVKRIPEGKTSGCALVSVNKPAFNSYGHNKKLSQSPVCWDCAEQYLNVVQFLVDSDRHSFRLPPDKPPPKQKLMYIFWSRQPSEFEMARMLSNPDPDEVKHLMESVQLGRTAAIKDVNEFYALALSGSKTRIIVRDWLKTTIPRVEANLARYFLALEIVDEDGEPGNPLKLHELIEALIPSKGANPWKDLSPNLAAQFVHAVINGTPLPGMILQRAVARARAEQALTRPRAALIKLCLLLSAKHEEGLQLTAEMNPDINDTAYLCGRLLAILESVQNAAIPGAKATLIDKYYGTAATAPASVFGLLMRQAQSHLAKLRKDERTKGAHYRLQEALEEVAGRITEFPTTLRLNEQGKFALGYYQQRAADRAARNEAVAAKKANAAVEEINSQGGTENV